MRVRVSHAPHRFFNNTTDPCSPETLVASIRALSRPDGDSLPSIRIGNSSLTLPHTDRWECFLYCPNVTFTVLLGAKRADTATITRGLPSFRKIGPCERSEGLPVLTVGFKRVGARGIAIEYSPLTGLFCGRPTIAQTLTGLTLLLPDNREC